ncbi:MAG: c-type cytochrome [Methylococcales bacterium]|nr:c-type cytochrome [Methylococcales bacterium]
MKTIITILALTLLGVSNLSVAVAADVAKGEEIFTANCAGCHAGGKNFMSPHKSLSKEDLEKNQVNTAAAIIDKVTNGKSPMPGFGKLGILSAADIENVAAYVLKKSDAGW